MKYYLSGAMEYAPDEGKNWRADMEQFLRSELNAEVFNPVEQGPSLLKPFSVREFREFKTSDLTKYVQLVRSLIRADIHQILEEVDCVICYWDEHARNGGGTHGELTLAFHRQIPVLMVTDIVLQDISGWILGCSTEIFRSTEDLKKYLQQKR